jgi:multiple sugar transport system permease protein
MVGTSVKPPIEYISSTVDLLPNAPTLVHYHQLIEDDIMGKMLNSLVVAFGSTLLALLAGFPAAYALVRLRLPKRLDIIFLVFVLVIKLSPPIVLAIPLYQVLRTLRLLDTLVGLILVYQVYTLPFAIWMLIGFIRDVSVTYEEAALIDGAGLFTRLVTVVLPIMKPGLIATAVFLLVLCWNEFIYALLFIQTPSKFTLPTFIATLITEDETFWGRLAAIGFLASLPILVLVGVVQKGLTHGFAGGLK